MAWYNDPPYDDSITCSAYHLKRIKSNSLHNFHSLNSCHSQPSHHKDVSLSAPPRSLTLLITSKFSCSYELHALTQSCHVPTFNTPHPLPSSPTNWLSTTRGEFENYPTPEIRQGNLEITAFPLITLETQRCCTVLTPSPLFLEQNNQEQNKSSCPHWFWTQTSLKGFYIWFLLGIELELPVYFCAVLTSTSCWPGNCVTLSFYKITDILLE